MFVAKTAGTVDAFRDHLIHCRYSPHAIRGYIARVRNFLDCAFEQQTGTDILVDAGIMQVEVDKFIQDLKEKGAKASYINSMLTSLKRFCAFLDLRNVQFKREFESPADKPTITLDKAQQEDLFELIRGETLARDRALALLVFLGGLRACECVAMNLSDIVFEGQVASVTVGAVARRRQVFLSEALSQELQEWLCRRKELPVADADAVFLNKLGRRIKATTLDMILKKIGRRARLDVSVRLLRDTYVTNMVEQGFEPAMVAAISGSKFDSLQRFYSKGQHQTWAAYGFAANVQKFGGQFLLPP